MQQMNPMPEPGSEHKKVSSEMHVATIVFPILFIVALLAPATRTVTQITWVSVNLLYATMASCWAAFHWGPLWAARDLSMRWSVSLTIVGTLLAYSQYFTRRFDSWESSQVNLDDSGRLVWIVMALIALFMLVFLLSLCLLGAAIGAFVGRKTDASVRTAQHGVHICMATVLSAMVFAFEQRSRLALGSGHTLLLFVGIMFSFPLLTRFYSRLPGNSTPISSSLFRRIRKTWDRLLVLRIKVGQQNRLIDGRGAAVGIITAIILLRLPTVVVAPLQSQAFTTLAQIRTTLWHSIGIDSGTPLRKTEGSGKTSSGFGQAQNEIRHKIVIVQLDGPARYRTYKTSEVAVQADIISQLSRYNPTRIVLPFPFLYNGTYPNREAPDLPAPNQEDIAHNRRDLPKLLAAIAKSGKVVVALPPHVSMNHPTVLEVLSKIPTGKKWVGTTDLPVSAYAYLPMIPAHWIGTSLPPLPVLLSMAFEREGSSSVLMPRANNTTFPSGVDLKAMQNVAHPGMASDGVLVDFLGEGVQHDFLHISYSAIQESVLLPVTEIIESPNIQNPSPRSGKGVPLPFKKQVATSDSLTDGDESESQPDSRSHTVTQWLPIAKQIEGKVVYLDSIAHPMQFTPIGPLTQSEEQAYALTTLLTHESLMRVPSWCPIVLIVGLGFLVGLICGHKEPIDAILQVSVPLALLLIISVFTFMAGRWLDPVLPVLTILMTLTLATHMHFAHERDDRQRTREMFGRFVAPHMVKEWLAQSDEELGLGGKREKLCVLFADVRGFTPFTERHDASEVIDVINAYMTAITDALHAHNGILDKYTGDGLMAFFLVNRSLPNRSLRKRSQQGDTTSSAERERMEIRRAVLASLAMRDAAIALSAERAREEKTVLQLGFSLHYGEAVVGLVGNMRQQVNYTALGHTVVVAARLQTVASGGEIVVSENVYRLVMQDFEFEDRATVSVKGISVPIHPYNVIGVRKYSKIATSAKTV